MTNKTRIQFLFSVTLIVFLVGYFYPKIVNKKVPSESITKSPAPTTKSIPEVVTMTVRKQEIQTFKELPARISAYSISQVRPQADGIIRKRLFEEGSFVEAGQALYQIDPSIYQANYSNAYAKLKTTKLKKDRFEKLLKIDAVSKQEYDEAVTNYAQAQGDVKKANIHLNYTKIYAPISGYIGISNITEGALVSANQSQVLTTITKLDPIFADISIPTKELMNMGNQTNIPVTVLVDNVEDNNKGTLKFSEVFADESTDSIRLRAEFSNSDQKLLPGMFVNVKLHLNPVRSIIIPQRVTNRDKDGNLTLWVVDKDNIAQLRTIKANKTFKNHWIVLQGLTDGERVIYKGFQKISNGSKVKAKSQIKPVSLKLIYKFASNE